MIDSIYHFITGPQLLWSLLGIGLAVLTVGLLILMRTRWGQSQPLGKCAAFSLLAHLLLAGYATTVQIVTGGIPTETLGANSFSMTYLESGRLGSQIDEEQELSIAGDTEQKIWDQFPGELDEHLTEPVELARPALSLLPETDFTTEHVSVEPAASSGFAESLDRADQQLLELLASDGSRESFAAPLSYDPPVFEDFGDELLPESDTPQLDSTPADSEPEETEPEKTDSAESNTAETEIDEAVTNQGQPEEIETASETVETVSDEENSAILDDQYAWETRSEVVEILTRPQSELLPPNETVEAADADSVEAAQDQGVRQGTQPTRDSEPPLVPIRAIGLRQSSGEFTAVSNSEGEGSLANDAETNQAIGHALRWLAANQNLDGHWDANGFSQTQIRWNRGTDARADTGMTGLALLAFIGSGHTHRSGPYAKNVELGIDYLLRSQASNGSLGGTAERYAFMYCHGIATIALSEAFVVTRDPKLEQAVRAAVAYSIAAQHQGTGSWHYQSNSPGDLSQLGWQLMALTSAQQAGIEIPERTKIAMAQFLRSVSSGQHGGLASYRQGENPTRTMTAEGLVCRQYLGVPRTHASCREAADFLLTELPSVEERPNLYYWYYGSLGMQQMRGDYWQQWHTALQSALVSRQNKSGSDAGSWDEEILWGGYGGRVYSTAMATLCLQIHARKLPLYAEDVALQPSKDTQIK